MLTTHEIVGLSFTFSQVLRDRMTAEHLAEAIERNAGDGSFSEVCHTHDHYDANVFMIEAFTIHFGQEPDLSDKSDAETINSAWTIARLYSFAV